MTTTRTLTAAALVALVLTACGGTDAPRSTSEPLATAPTSGAPDSTPAAPAVSTSAPVADFAEGDPAVESFGAERVQEALVIAQDLALAGTASVDLLDAEKDSPEEIVSAVDTFLTGEARTRLAQAAQSIPTDSTQADNVAVQMVFAAYAEGDLQPVSPYLAAWSADGYEVSLDEDGRLGVDLTITSEALYEDGGVAVTYPVERQQFYAMLPSPEDTDGPAWLVDEWASTTTVGDPR